MTTELIALTARLERIEQDNTAVKAEYATVKADNLRLRAQFGQAQRKLKVQMGLTLFALVGAILLSPANRAALAQGYGVTLAGLNTRLAAIEAKTQVQDSRLSAVETKTQYMTTDATAKSTIFSGCNVIVYDGGGSTGSIVTNSAGAGLGNLIIGYNAPRGSNQNIRNGSHNLIIGDLQNYSSYGGLIAGYGNTISGQYASVSGGYGNTAGSFTASVSGGGNNTASGDYSSVSGGGSNTASGLATSISGGFSVLDSTKLGWAAGNTNFTLTNVGGTYHSN